MQTSPPNPTLHGKHKKASPGYFLITSEGWWWEERALTQLPASWSYQECMIYVAKYPQDTPEKAIWELQWGRFSRDDPGEVLHVVLERSSGLSSPLPGQVVNLILTTKLHWGRRYRKRLDVNKVRKELRKVFTAMNHRNNSFL